MGKMCTNLIRLCCSLVLLLFTSTGVFAQVGTTCAEAIEISSLPYTTTDNTSNYADNYDFDVDVCGSSGSYFKGNDVVYTYTATGDESINITMSPGVSWTSLYVVDACENIGISCLANVANTGSADRVIENLEISDGETIYILLSIWSTPEIYSYTLEITENIPCAEGLPTAGLFEGDACDDGNENTIDDLVTADCLCVGTPVPANDEACGAFVLECGEELTDQTFLGAGQSIDDACYGSGTADVWYNFVSDGTQIYHIAEVSDVNVVVELLKGDDCGNLTSVVACDDSPEEFFVEEEGNYYFRVRPYSTGVTHSVALNCYPITTNDEACGALALACGDTLTSTFIGATESIDDACYGSGTADVWYSFVADGTASYHISEVSGTDVVVELFKGDDCANLTSVGACDDTPEYFYVEEEGNYYFRVRPYGNTGIIHSVTLTCYPRPVNDEACGALTIACSDTLSGTFLGATESIADSCNGDGTADVWFTFVSDGTQVMSITETESDVVVEGFLGDDCGNLTSISACSDLDETLTILEAGNYYFRVRPYGSATTFGVALSCFEPLVNDEVCFATEIACGDTLVDQTFLGATQSVDDDCYGSGSVDVWYSFVADGIHQYTFAETSSSDITMELFQGDACGDITSVDGCSDNESMVITTAGNYFVRIRAYSTATTHTVMLACLAPVTNDEVCDATAMVCGTEISGNFFGATESVEDEASGSGTADIWFTVVSDGAQVMTFSETSSSNVVMEIYQGEACEEYALVTAAFDTPENYSIEDAGTYFIRLRPYSNATTFAVSMACEDFECTEILENFGNSCDDGNPDTHYDVITEDCECIGETFEEGEICETAITVSGLPYTTSGNTADYGDDYDGSPGSNGCGSSSGYLTGDDVVYEYTAGYDQSINISLNPETSWSGIFVYGSCADIGVNCLAGVANSNSNERLIEFFTLSEGETIYIVISTYTTPQSVAYDLSITENLSCPPGTETEGLIENDPCDDGDAGTMGDTVTADCECVGIPIPSNDEICGATLISCGDTLVDQTFIGASLSLEDDCVGTGTVDVWYNIESDGSQIMIISETTSANIVFELFQGIACDTVVSAMPCTNDESIQIEEAGNYFLRVRPYSTSDTFNIALTCVDPVPNDEPCTAIVLTCGEELVNQTLIGSSLSEDYACSSGYGIGDVWYSFTAEADNQYTISADDSDADVLVSLYQGDECGNLTEIGSCSDFTEYFVVEEAGNYFFQVQSYWSDENDITVSLQCLSPVTNDDACDAIELFCGDEYSGQSFYGATQSEDDDCGGSGIGDVWYKFVSDGSEMTTIAETETDVVVEVYMGDECGTLTSIVACADSPESYSTQEAGTYYFRIRPWGSASTYGVSLTCTPFDCEVLGVNFGTACDDGDATTVDDEINEDCICMGVPIPANDEPCNATPLGAFAECVNIVGTNMGASTSDVATPSCGAYNFGGDVWYSVIVPASGNVSIETSGTGTGTDSVISAYEGDCEDGLTQISCDDQGGEASFSLIELTGRTPGEMIFIRVWEYGNNNDLIFNICATTDGEVFDCPIIGANIDDACDDGDENTENDVITEDCECAGTAIITFDCPELEANYGDECDDENDATVGDAITDNCECVGTVGIAELSDEDKVMGLFGNTIKVYNTEKVATVSIFSVTGKLMQTESASSGEVNVDNSLARGIYIAVAYDKAGNAIQYIKLFN